MTVNEENVMSRQEVNKAVILIDWRNYTCCW